MNVAAFLRRFSSAERTASGGDAETIRERRMAELRALLADIAPSPVRTKAEEWRAAECKRDGHPADVCCA